jgi:hypothetical protein
VDITPPIGTLKIGWLTRIVSEELLDPLFARACVLLAGAESIAFIGLDTLSIRWTQVAEIRKAIEGRFGFPGAKIMVAATHNHAGPAVANVADVPRDEGYIETLVAKVVEAFGAALAAMEQAEIGLGSCFEFGISHNRRVVMRDGTVRTHGSFDDPMALCLEGPIDPEVAVMAARSAGGRPLGVIINFACHPTHYGPTGELSAGYPGALGRRMNQAGWPVTVFLNGASGNLHDADPTRGGAGKSAEQIGAVLAVDAGKVIESMDFTGDVTLAGRSRTVRLPYRQVTQAEVKGTVRGAQRFVDGSVYERSMSGLLERIGARGTQLAEVQVLFVNDRAFAAIPAEYFAENALRIKQSAGSRHALVVSCANGMVGYVPHRDAFRRGGYETTFSPWSRMAPEAGDVLADAAIELIEAQA